MTKSLLIKTFIIIVILIGIFMTVLYIKYSVLYDTSVNGDNYQSIVKLGKELLLEKYPENVSESDGFLAYYYNGIWHVQNIIANEKNGIYMEINSKVFEQFNHKVTRAPYTDNDIEEYSEESVEESKKDWILTTSKLESIRYVKISNLKNVKEFGSYEDEHSRYSIQKIADVKNICLDLIEQLLPESKDKYSHSEIYCNNNEFFRGIISYEESYNKSSGYITLRKSDGLILFIEDPEHQNHTTSHEPTLKSAEDLKAEGLIY